jgi:acyl-coenzyme A synthetase/AMP-(fatty) acid ligase
MSLREILERHSQSPDTRDNAIGDGSFSCTYGGLPALLAQVDGFLADHGVDSGMCAHVECPNTLPGALLALALMRRGNGAVLAPPTVNQDEIKPVPRFCRFRLTVLPAASAGGAEFSPAAFLLAARNPQYNGKTAAPAHFYLRTSGSMGASKIVSHDLEKLTGNAHNIAAKYGFRAQSRVTVPVPIAHMYGGFAEFLPAILTGASIDLQDKTNLLKYLDREKRFQPDIAFVTPAICEMLLKGYKTPRTGYRVMVTSGQRIGEPLFRAFDPMVSGRLVNQYGSTEMGGVAACDPAEPLDKRATSIGEPMGGVKLKIEDGVLFCQHPFGFEGYLDEDGEWLQREPPGGWYRTGDVAQVSADGAIAVIGRADASVNRSGYLVLLADIERVMEKLDGAAEVAVMPGRGETMQGQRIVAFCVLRPGFAMDGTELRKQCFDVLPRYAIPDEVRVVDKLPLLASGKVDRQGLDRQDRLIRQRGDEK